MSFAAGVYTLPTSVNPIVTATTITSNWANTTLNDVATALTTCLLKDGTQVATAQIPLAQGLTAGGAFAIDSSGNLAITTNKFTINAATGNTAIAGTLGVTGAQTFTGQATFAAAASAIFGTTHKWYAFNDANYTYLTDTASGVGVGLRCSPTEVALLVSGSAVLTATTSTMSTADSFTACSATAIPAGGTTAIGLQFSSTGNFGVFFGSGAPTLSAAKGSLYLRSDGSGTGDRAYINTNGSNTWTALTTAA